MSDTRMTPTPRSAGERRRRVISAALWLLLAWIVIIGLVIAFGEAVTGPVKDSIGSGDNHVERVLAQHRSGTLTDVADDLSLLGETWTVVIAGLVLMLLAWLWRREFWSVTFVAVALVGEITGYLLVVSIVSRSRPPVRILDPGLDPNHSYPSGHVAAAMGLYGGAALLIWMFSARRWRWLSAALIVLPLLVALARLYLGAHHPSDVLTSIVFMSAWLAVAAVVLLRGATRSGTSADPDDSPGLPVRAGDR
jgi:membrane-associated phospholipid phosphatase